jgi:hypothetical protein
MELFPSHLRRIRPVYPLGPPDLWLLVQPDSDWPFASSFLLVLAVGLLGILIERISPASPRADLPSGNYSESKSMTVH